MRRLCWIALLAMGCREKVDGTDTETVDTTPDTIDADADGYATEDGDCNDADASIYPGGVEICDGIDNNCDGAVDEGVTTTFFADADGDGFGDPNTTAEACDQPDGFVLVTNDCDDTDEATYPGAGERCDEADNDCDGEIDEDVQTEWYADADSDGYGDADSGIDDCDPPAGYVDSSDDCNDLSAAAYPGAEEVCDEIDNDCDDIVDEDVTTTYYQDADGDNYGVSDVTTEACTRPGGHAEQAGDCEDTDSDINPSATELCDEIDNDCDGDTDEDDAADASTWYADDDSDGYGDVSDTTTACSQPTGYVASDNDCDDTTASVSPAAAEVCDEVDNDCDGDTDEDTATDAATWYADSDGDGYGSTSSTVACSQPSGFADNSDDCNDAEADANPGEAEVCDEIDNDCDGDTDEGLTSTWYLDYDGDGYGDSDRTTDACSAPTGYVSDATDCDDAEADANPGETEVCDEIDNDCDGNSDEGLTSTFYDDDDGDGYGDESDAVEACTAPSGTVSTGGDCDDRDSAISPDAQEVCDGEDNDCDELIDDEDDSLDESTAEVWYPDSDGDGYGAEPASCVELRDAGFSDGIYTIFPFGDGTSIDVYCDMTDDDGGWMRIFHHDAQGNTAFFSSSSDASLRSEDDPEALLYSILDHMAYFEDASGGFTFRIDWPEDTTFTGANIWSQTSDPTTSSISGYAAIDIDYTAQYWGGLELSTSSSTFIDGSVSHSNWYYSIGSQTSWSGGIPGPSAAVDVVSLWVRTDESAYSSGTLACEQPSDYTDLAGDCDDNDDDTHAGAEEACDGEDNNCDGVIDDGVIGESSSCPAESCAEIVAQGADDGDGEYYLDPEGDGSAEAYTCDMTTDGGGWTMIVDWDRASDGDSVTDFESWFTEEANTMSIWRTSSGASYLEWADNNATADVLSYRADVDVPNGGELLYDVYLYGYSMEQSAVWIFADVGGTFSDLMCREDLYGAYTSSELAYEPYACASTATTWTWNDTSQQTTFSGEIDAMYMRSLMYDTYGDYVRLYRLGFWVR